MRWRRAGLLVGLLPLLTGCMSMDADLDLRSDGTTRYSLVLSVTSDYLQEVEAEPTEYFCNDLERFFPNSQVDAELAAGGVTCRVDGTALTAELGDQLQRTTGATISHYDGAYRFSWASGSDLDSIDLIDDFEFSITFPGEVLEHSGSSTVWFNTVTWRDPADLLSDTGLAAAGRDRGQPWPALVGVAGLLVLTLLIMARLRATRRSTGVTALPEPADADEVRVPPPIAPPPDPAARRSRASQPPETWAPRPSDLPGDGQFERDESYPIRRDPAVQEPPAERSPWAPPV